MIRFLQKPGPIKKIVLGGLLTIVCVMMVITLVPGGLFGNYFGGGSLTTQGVIAKVGDQEIDVQQVSQEARMEGKQQFKGNVPEQLMPYLMQRAAQKMIMQKAIVLEADRMGFGASDDEVRQALHQGELGQAFFPDGKFVGQETYEQMIQNSGQTVREFEQGLKGGIAAQKLITAVVAPIAVSDKDITAAVQREQSKVKFDYAVLSLDDTKKDIKPSDVELKAFYNANKQSYANSIPEKLKAKYILIDSQKIAEKVEITPEELQAYYKQHQDDYRIPETVTVRHILIKTPPADANGKVDQKGVDAARAKADDVNKQLKAGANFADLAKKYSEDPGSAKDGGLLPPLTRGRTVPEFEQAAFSTPVGQTTAVIRTSYGFHIIHVEAKQEARLKPLEEVKVEIEPTLKQQKAAAQSQSVASAIQTLARTNGMDKAAADRNLILTTTDLIAQADAIPGIGPAPDFSNALFTAKKNDPPALATTPAGYVVYQVIEIQPPQTPTFDQIKDKIEAQFKDQRAQQLLGQKTQELSDRAHADHDLAKAAKEVGATVKTSDLVDRTGQVPDVGPMTGQASVAFGMKVGEISSPIQGGPNGVVLKIVEVQQPTPDQIKQGWDKAKEALVEQKREEYENLYVENLRDRLEKEGKIKINKKEMERLTATSEGS